MCHVFPSLILVEDYLLADSLIFMLKFTQV